MVIEVVCGYAFGSLALVADGLHMSTHVAAFLIAALAYSYARTHAHDTRFSFGTGKIGDLAGFTSAIILAIISVFILYDGMHRLIQPTHIKVRQAWPVAVVGLAVNVMSGFVLMGGCGIGGVEGAMMHDHLHSHTHSAYPTFSIHDADEEEMIAAPLPSAMETKESYAQLPVDDPENHINHDHSHVHGRDTSADTDNTCAGDSPDNNMKAAIVHVLADALVSALVLLCLCVLAYFPKLVWLDALAGCLGALVILSWAAVLLGDTVRTLLDMTPHASLAGKMKSVVGPNQCACILSIQPPPSTASAPPIYEDQYRVRLRQLCTRWQVAHLTIEVARPTQVGESGRGKDGQRMEVEV
eukprot:gene33567-40608_t